MDRWVTDYIEIGHTMILFGCMLDESWKYFETSESARLVVPRLCKRIGRYVGRVQENSCRGLPWTRVYKAVKSSCGTASTNILLRNDRIRS